MTGLFDGAVPGPGLGPDGGGVLVGTETGDDAGVYLVRGVGGVGGVGGEQGDGDLALVVTADYISPPLDDPGVFGQIAAANALSDVYAMGGLPRCALNLCMLPDGLDRAVAREILIGARDKVREAGAVVLGGHTVRGKELFFGLSVTGTVQPRRIWRNIGARPGDVLLLTKPIGTGLLVTGLRRGLVAVEDIGEAIAGMVRLNAAAARTLRDFPVHAATDVTGFGLAGHALGMTRGEDVAVRLVLSRVPLYPGAGALAEAGVTCAGAQANARAYAARIAGLDALSVAAREVLHDPQTSGGLLCAVPAAAAMGALAALAAAGVPAAQIGDVVGVGAGSVVGVGERGAIEAEERGGQGAEGIRLWAVP